MVSGDEVRGDKDKVTSAKDSFTSSVEGLNGSWQGPSYDSITAQIESFSNEFFPAIDSQLESFAKACDLYKDYEENKKDLETAKTNLNDYKAKQSSREKNEQGKYTVDYSSDIEKWSSKVTECEGIKKDLTEQINSALSEATSEKLTATAISETDFSGGAISSYAPKSIPKLSSGASVSVSGAGGAGATGNVQQQAIDWATSIANNNKYGYSQNNRWGNPDYDCSSLVLQAYENAGIKVKEAGASYTGNMKSALLKSGFEFVSGTPNVNNLQPGDILWRNGHTEMYIGNGKMVGAHQNSDGKGGDSSGNEISITKYKNKSWAGYFRYVGNK